ncbi:MAG: Mth938-like domain-containing protein [Methylobacterium sp.]|nr:Mth938-like domain-containing protein [Methylobacterium sp.]MCA3600486.1 Mth938-like domain-containing protein [Methylobacterium sp.]MCA3606656.1 Mth938-like domain-containing protein [Methylobacterium sp.]MCA3609443.1 Mth938-like domain-containing protein [Methylobacterium sp.]MCA3611686.1 Mth938-like domain-containing protein [Methylobacterium sp.]
MSAAARGPGFAPGRHPIEGYGADGFRFAGMAHPGSILALPSGIRAWPLDDLALVGDADLAPLHAEREAIELLIIGSGRKAMLPFGPLADRLREAGFRPEFMDTPAAARTYNVLLAENRRVAALLVRMA